MDIRYLHIYILCFIFCLTGFSYPLLGQQKFEKEFRITEKEAPAKAISFIKEAPFDRRIKWYREESNNGQSIEAKTRYRKILFSVEFDTLGNVEDVELKIPFHNITESTIKVIEAHFENDFDKWKVVKTQVQWIGADKDLISQIKGLDPKSSFAKNFEIVVEGKSNGEFKLYEFLFSNSGEIIRKDEIIPQRTDHLDF